MFIFMEELFNVGHREKNTCRTTTIIMDYCSMYSYFGATGLDSSGSGQGSMSVSQEQSNSYSDFIKTENILAK